MIRINQMTVKYGSKEVFNQFDLTINKGEKVLLKAPSGKGKSTLIKAILGFVPLDFGTITVGDIKMSSKSIGKIRGSIAYVSQDVDILADNMLDYIEEVSHYKWNKNQTLSDERIKNYLDLLGLESSLLTKPTADLSGGERQRMGLLLAFLLERDIMLLDEVTSGLDQDLKQIVYDYIMGLNTTCIIISHDSIWDTENVRQVTL